MIVHPFNNPQADGLDPTIARPSDWNAKHLIGDVLINANAGTISPGAPAYCSGAGTMDLAKADVSGTSECIGLVVGTLIAGVFVYGAVGTGISGFVQELDSVTLTTVQWDTITGGSGGLTPLARYYVSATTAGQLTTVAPSPSAAGQSVVYIGLALSTTLMRLRVQPPIGL